MDFCLLLIFLLSFVGIIGNIFVTSQNNDDKDVKIVVNWILWVINFILIIILAAKSHPTAIDVYRGNTELNITSVNGVPTDTIVVYKRK